MTFSCGNLVDPFLWINRKQSYLFWKLFIVLDTMIWYEYTMNMQLLDILRSYIVIGNNETNLIILGFVYLLGKLKFFMECASLWYSFFVYLKFHEKTLLILSLGRLFKGPISLNQSICLCLFQIRTPSKHNFISLISSKKFMKIFNLI